MSLIIPSCNVKSKFLKSLPVGTVFEDPRNHYNYEIIEKKINSTLSKVAVPYISGDKEPIQISVPERHLKLEHPQRANIMQYMKQKILELESINDELLKKKGKSTFQQIQDLLGENQEYFETESEVFCIDKSCIVIPAKIKNYFDVEEAKKSLKELQSKMWKDHELLQKIMRKQPSVQSKVLNLLSEK